MNSQLSFISLGCPFYTRVEIDVLLTNLILSHLLFIWDGVEEELRISVSVVLQFCFYLPAFHLREVVTDAACVALCPLPTIVVDCLVDGIIAHHSDHRE